MNRTAGSDAEEAKRAFAIAFAAMLREGVRQRSGQIASWKNEALADAIKISAVTVSYWRNGHRLPEPTQFEALTTVLSLNAPSQGDRKAKLEHLRALWERARSFSRRGKQESSPSQIGGLFGVPTALPRFVGRRTEFEAIDAFFAAKPKKPWLTLVGMAGIGKTVCVAEYLRRDESPFSQVWWCEAETRESLCRSLEGLGHKLGVPRHSDVPIEHFVRAALDAAFQGSWCLVYNNAELPATIADLLPFDETPLFLTSRISDWREWSKQLLIGELSENESVELLGAKTSPECKFEAIELARAVQFLPLALSHAAAACEQPGTSFSKYTKEIRKYISVRPPNARYPSSIFATIQLAIARIPSSENAKQLLCALCFLGTERIPDFLIEELTVTLFSEDNPQTLLDLLTYSLVKRDLFDDGTAAVSVHRLVREVGKEIANESLEETKSLVISTECLYRVFPRDVGRYKESWDRCKQLVPHYFFLNNNTELSYLDADMWVSLTTSVARYLVYAEDYKTSKTLSKSAADLARQHLSMDNPTLHEALSQYALTLEDGVHDLEALSIYRELLPYTIDSLGPRDPFIATCLVAIGKIEREKEQWQKAETAFLSAIDILEENPDSIPGMLALCIANLGLIKICNRRFLEGRVFLKDAIALASGDSVHDIHALLVAFEGLTFFYFSKKQYDEGVLYANKAIDLAVKISGSGANAASRYKLLGDLLANVGRDLQAQENYEHALAMIEENCSPPTRRLFRTSIGEFFCRRGKYDRACAIFNAEIQDVINEQGSFSVEADLLLLKISNLFVDMNRAPEAMFYLQPILESSSVDYDNRKDVITNATEIYSRAAKLLQRDDGTHARGFRISYSWNYLG